MLTRTKLRMTGVSLTETLVMMPVFLMLTLGIIQFALIYEAKSSLDYATFMGARAGALDHAKQGAISEGLAKSLSPLFSPDLHNQAALQATIAKARAEIAAFSDIKIINPTTEAFDDFGINENGQQAIPNGMLHVRDPKPGDRSRVNIQDANLLKVQVLYGHRLQVPFVNRIISTVTSWFTIDPVKLAYLHQQRLPILATATVRMQSTPWKNDWMMRLADVNKAVEDASQPGEALNLATLPRPWGGPTGERDRGSSSQSGGQGGAATDNVPGTAPDGSTSGDQTSADGTGQGSPSPCDSRQTTSLPTSVQAVAENNYGHPDKALNYLERMTRSFSYAHPGSMYEVSPDYGMVVQAWNIYGFAIPIVKQFFGINPDAANKIIVIKPQMPEAWDNAALENVIINDNEVSVFYEKAEGKLRLKVTQTDADYTLQIMLPKNRFEVESSSIEPSILSDQYEFLTKELTVEIVLRTKN